MDLVETLKILLDNQKLMEEYHYTKQDIEKLNFKEEHKNDFIRFMQAAVRVMNNDTATERQVVNNIIKAFDTQNRKYENSQN